MPDYPAGVRLRYSHHRNSRRLVKGLYGTGDSASVMMSITVSPSAAWLVLVVLQRVSIAVMVHQRLVCLPGAVLRWDRRPRRRRAVVGNLSDGQRTHDNSPREGEPKDQLRKVGVSLGLWVVSPGERESGLGRRKRVRSREVDTNWRCQGRP